MAEGNRFITEIKGLEAAAGGASASPVVTANVPSGLEFAYWGYSPQQPGAMYIAFRVLTAGDYSWADEGDVSLSEGFNFDATHADANLASMQVGQYVIVGISGVIPASTYASYVSGWGFDPQHVLPGSWQPVMTTPAIQSHYNNVGSHLTATDVQSAIDELVARIVALENP